MGNEQPNAEAELAPEEREPRELALEEQFLAEYRAGGRPRLADYLRAYPEHTAALTDFVARLLSEGETTEPSSRPAPLSAGTQRALHALFAEPDASQGQRRAVAESRAPYTAAENAPDAETHDAAKDAEQAGEP
ncbi:MAG: hypothetical protein ACRDHE_14645 [Ktedonobacterales bacterium]